MWAQSAFSWLQSRWFLWAELPGQGTAPASCRDCAGAPSLACREQGFMHIQIIFILSQPQFRAVPSYYRIYFKKWRREITLLLGRSDCFPLRECLIFWGISAAWTLCSSLCVCAVPSPQLCCFLVHETKSLGPAKDTLQQVTFLQDKALSYYCCVQKDCFLPSLKHGTRGTQ